MMAPKFSQLAARHARAGQRRQAAVSTAAATARPKPASSVIRIDLRRGVVLGLGEKIGGDPGGVVVLVGDDHHLGGSGDHVDADLAEHLALGGRHIGVAGTHDLDHGGDRLGAIGKRRDRLRAADAIDLIDAGKLRRHEHQRIEHPVGRRHHHDDALDLRHLGGDRVHQHRARIARGAARHIEARRLDRRPAVAERHALLVDIAVARRHLAAVMIEDAVAGELERGKRLGVDARRAPRRSQPGSRACRVLRKSTRS